MAGNRNDTAVDDSEAIMTPKARLSKGVVGRRQASAMAMLGAVRRHAICVRYPEYVRERGAECHVKTMYLRPVHVRVWNKAPFGQDDDELADA